MTTIDNDALWRDMVLKHTVGGACNFRSAAFEFAEEAVRAEREAIAATFDNLTEIRRSGVEIAAAIRAREINADHDRLIRLYQPELAGPMK